MVLLEKVTSVNAADVSALKVRPEQEVGVWKNEDWVDVARMDPSWQLYAVIYGDAPIGLAVLTQVTGGQEWKLVYLMIDREWQGVGYGRQAVEALSYLLSGWQDTDCFLAEARNDGEETLLAHLGFVRMENDSRFFRKEVHETEPEVSLRQIGVTHIFLCREELENTDPGEGVLLCADIGIGFPVLLEDHHQACARMYRGDTKTRIRIVEVDEQCKRSLRQQYYWARRFSVNSLEVLCGRIISRAGYRRMWQRRLDRMHALLERFSDEECETLQEKGRGYFLYGANEDGTILYFEDDMGMSYVMENGYFYNERTGEPIGEM